MFGNFFHKMASPPWFYRISGKLIPWVGTAFALLLLYGLYGGLVLAPADYQQGDSFRIIYIHVPAAWMSLFIYVLMAVCGVITLVWRMKMAEVVLIASAPVGAAFTFLALVTGSIWGKPMWGTWWVWDGRLTSELILLFLYLGVIALHNAIEDRQTAAKAVAILAIVGVVNVPIIHYSVEWWEHRGIDAGTALPKKARRLMQRVPPLDRKLDDRNVDRADEDQDRYDAPCPRGVLEGAPERD
jgi:heme exporter protein C